VVDDADDTRELLKSALTQYCAGVVAAGSAAEAFELITTAPTGELPDMMVIDLGMPGEDRACRTGRNHHEPDQTPEQRREDLTTPAAPTKAMISADISLAPVNSTTTRSADVYFCAVQRRESRNLAHCRDD